MSENIMPFNAPDSLNTVPLKFDMTGNRFLYSNNPEALYNTMGTASGNLGNMDGLYTVEETDLPVGQYYVAEWYHHVPAGTTTYRIGVAINNPSSTTKQFRWTNAAKKYASLSLPTADAGAELFPLYFNSTNDQYTSVAGGQTSVFYYDDVAPGNLSVGRVKLAARDSGLKVRIFCIKKNKITDANHVFRLPKALDSQNGVSSGSYYYDTRRVSQDFSQIGQGFKLSAYANYNNTEYEAGRSGYLGPQYRQGNYGIQYDISIPGSGGKAMKIYPTVSGTATGPYARIVLKRISGIPLPGSIRTILRFIRTLRCRLTVSSASFSPAAITVTLFSRSSKQNDIARREQNDAVVHLGRLHRFLAVEIPENRTYCNKNQRFSSV